MARTAAISRPGPAQKARHAQLLKAVPESARTFGYARVSREDQNLDAQLTALRGQKIPEDCLFVEKISAVSAHRPQFHLLMKNLEPGDTVVVYAFSRLHRNVKELLTLVDEFKVAGINLRSTSEPHINPFTTNGRLLVSITGAVDENELNRIADRTRDGMAARKLQGQWFGRQRVVTKRIYRAIRTLSRREVPAKLAVRQIRKRFGVTITASTFYSYANTAHFPRAHG